MNTLNSTNVTCIVTWDPPKKLVSQQQLESAARGAGIPDKLVKPLKPKSAFSRAIKDMAEGRVIRKVEENEDIIFFQFTKESKAHKKLEYQRECIIELDKNTGVMTGDNDELLQLARHEFNQALANRTSNDVTNIVKKYFAAASEDLIPMRRHGGVYMVTESGMQLVQSVSEFLTNIGGTMNVCHLQHTDDTQKACASSVSDYLLSLVDELNIKIERINESSRPSTYQKRLQEAAALFQKIKAYSATLGNLQAIVMHSLSQSISLLDAKKDNPQTGEK